MTLKQFIRLLLQNVYILLLCPLFVAIGIYFLTKNLPQRFESSTIIFTNPITERGANDGGAIRVDFYTSNNLFDNLTLLLKSRETITHASLRLLALHLLQENPDEMVFSAKQMEELRNHISPELRNSLVVPNNLEATFGNVQNHYLTYRDSPIEYLLREHLHYSVQEIITNLFVSRRASSDMMEVTYRADDAAICYYTLKFISEAFMERYSRMKEMENVNSIQYFEDQLNIAQQKLRGAEAELKVFMTDNRILNYYEQGKYLDIAKLEHQQDEERAKRLMTGTQSNLEKIEALFEGFESRRGIVKQIAELQNQVVRKNLELEGAKINQERSALASQIEKDINGFQQQIEVMSRELFNTSISLEGLPRKEALDEWLKLKILYEEQVQALKVMRERDLYLDEKIDEFAPLGAELKRLEREVSVNESQYLSILHGLNMAYLKKYDLEMIAPQKLIDEPYFPKKALPSQKAILVAGGFLGSGFFMLSAIILLFLIDPTIKSARKAEKLTGLKVAGGWINEKLMSKKVFYPILHNRLITQVSNHINQYLNPDRRPQILAFYALSEGEGKSFLVKKIIEDFKRQNRTVTYYGPDVVDNQNDFSTETFLFDSKKELFEGYNGVWRDRFKDCGSDYVIIEFPDFTEYHINYALVNMAHVLVMVLDATRSWTPANHETLENIKNATKIPHVVWLNRMNQDELEDINGEIPKARSAIRVKVKSLVS